MVTHSCSLRPAARLRFGPDAQTFVYLRRGEAEAATVLLDDETAAGPRCMVPVLSNAIERTLSIRLQHRSAAYQTRPRPIARDNAMVVAMGSALQGTGTRERPAPPAPRKS